MIPDVVPYLCCPVCRADLTAVETALRCPRGHSFDIARQGYVNLTRGRTPHTGDSAEMIEARAARRRAGLDTSSAIPTEDGAVSTTAARW